MHGPAGLPAHFYDVMLWDDAQHEAMSREIKEWKRRDGNTRKDVKVGWGGRLALCWV